MIGNEQNTSKSAIALFVFLGVVLLFLPCMSVIIVKFRRSRKNRAQHKAEEGNSGYWAEMASVTTTTTKPPGVTSLKKPLPTVHRNHMGSFQRATLREDGTYEAPGSFLQDLHKEEQALREEEQRHTRFEAPRSSTARPTAQSASSAAAAQGLYPKPEGRLLTPFAQPAAVILRAAPVPKPKKSVKSKLEEEGTAVQMVNSGQAGVGIPPRVRSKIAIVDDDDVAAAAAGLEDVDLRGHTRAPPGWI